MVELIVRGVLRRRETAMSVSVDWTDVSIIVTITIIQSVHSLSIVLAKEALDFRRKTQRAARVSVVILFSQFSGHSSFVVADAIGLIC